jgi:hypothetical protein
MLPRPQLARYPHRVIGVSLFLIQLLLTMLSTHFICAGEKFYLLTIMTPLSGPFGLCDPLGVHWWLVAVAWVRGGSLSGCKWALFSASKEPTLRSTSIKVRSEETSVAFDWTLCYLLLPGSWPPSEMVPQSHSGWAYSLSIKWSCWAFSNRGLGVRDHLCPWFLLKSVWLCKKE